MGLNILKEIFSFFHYDHQNMQNEQEQEVNHCITIV